jgi:hypothetical protein
MSNSSTKCDYPYTPDKILLVSMPVGPFTQPYGEDCFRNEIVCIILASLIAMFALMLGIVLLHDLLLRKLDRFLSALFALQACTLISIIIFCMFAIFKQEYCVWAWVFLTATVFIWATHAYWLIFNIFDKLKHLPGITKKDFTDTFLLDTITAVTLILCVICNIVSSIGNAVTVSIGDYSTEFYYWEAFSVSAAIFVGVCAIHSHFKFDFASKVIMRKKMENPNQLPDKDIDDFLSRMQQMKWRVLWTVPAGSGLWVLHAVLLPVFSYIAFIHLANAVGGIFMIYLAYTPKKHLRVVIADLCCSNAKGSSPDNRVFGPANSKRMLNGMNNREDDSSQEVHLPEGFIASRDSDTLAWRLFSQKLNVKAHLFIVRMLKRFPLLIVVIVLGIGVVSQLLFCQLLPSALAIPVFILSLLTACIASTFLLSFPLAIRVAKSGFFLGNLLVCIAWLCAMETATEINTYFSGANCVFNILFHHVFKHGRCVCLQVNFSITTGSCTGD